MKEDIKKLVQDTVQQELLADTKNHHFTKRSQVEHVQRQHQGLSDKIEQRVADKIEALKNELSILRNEKLASVYPESASAQSSAHGTDYFNGSNANYRTLNIPGTQMHQQPTYQQQVPYQQQSQYATQQQFQLLPQQIQYQEQFRPDFKPNLMVDNSGNTVQQPSYNIQQPFANEQVQSYLQWNGENNQFQHQQQNIHHQPRQFYQPAMKSNNDDMRAVTASNNFKSDLPFSEDIDIELQSRYETICIILCGTNYHINTNY